MRKWILALLMVGFAAGTVAAAVHEGHESAAQSTQAAAPAKQGDSKPDEPSVVYTCPMHPEVRQSQPGSCPKCGMALKPASKKTMPPAGNTKQEPEAHSQMEHHHGD